MSLPAFLAPGSPPRSPHVSSHSSQFSYFSRVAPQTGRSAQSIRPSRRDVLLILITLSFSYLLFSSPSPSHPVTPRPTTQSTGAVKEGSKYRLPEWASLWNSKHGQNSQSCDSAQMPRERNYEESVRTYGISKASLAEGPDDLDQGAGGKFWDGGVEEAEDDELESIATTLKGHQPGWTMFEKLYIYNGSYYVVTDDKSDWPELRLMTSTGLPAMNVPGNEQAREPKGDEIIFIKPYEAVKLWGPRILRLDGMTWLINDGQFLDHYYHFAAELLLGLWRTYMSLDQDITSNGATKLPAPQRIWFLHQNAEQWRDKPRFNSVLSFALFPSTSMLYPEDFADLKRITSEGQQKAYMLERAILADRSAAFRGPYTGPTSRTVASALQVGKTSRWWWEPLRRQMLRYASVPESVIDRNLEGFGAVDPALDSKPLLGAPGVVDLEPLSPEGTYKPLVTYISRQSSRRRLTVQAHAELVKALEERAKKVGFELLVIEAEKFSKEEQIAIAAKTTIMLGVHGNGLTHLLWMPPTPRSAVIEMFFKGGFARDYQWTAHALGIRHFGVQHDITFTAPHLPDVAYPEGFQGESITVDGKTVADIIEDRLAGRA